MLRESLFAPARSSPARERGKRIHANDDIRPTSDHRYPEEMPHGLRVEILNSRPSLWKSHPDLLVDNGLTTSRAHVPLSRDCKLRTSTLSTLFALVAIRSKTHSPVGASVGAVLPEERIEGAVKSDRWPRPRRYGHPAGALRARDVSSRHVGLSAGAAAGMPKPRDPRLPTDLVSRSWTRGVSGECWAAPRAVSAVRLVTRPGEWLQGQPDRPEFLRAHIDMNLKRILLMRL